MQVLMIPELENIKILSIKAKPIITNKNILDRKIALEGNIEFNILYYNKQIQNYELFTRNIFMISIQIPGNFIAA